MTALLLAATLLHLRVDAVPSRHSTSACIFVIRAPLVGGGSQTTCLTAIGGVPAPGATMHSHATMTFALAAGELRARVLVTQRFGPDGVHATQTVAGRLTGGTGRFAEAHGRVSGGGSVIDRRDGLGRVDLRYTIALA
jgi:hypothetical protein